MTDNDHRRRSPIAVAVVCDKPTASDGDVLTEAGQSGLDTEEVAGLALRGGSTWEFSNAAWASLNGSDASSASNCQANGADTVGVRDDFHRLVGLNTLFASTAV